MDEKEKKIKNVKKNKSRGAFAAKKQQIMLAVIAGLAVIIAGVAFVVTRPKKEEEPVAEVKTEVVVEEDTDIPDVDLSGVQTINGDINSWLYIPGTNISYPVLRASDDKDTDYYLRTAINHQSATAGSVYMQQRNAADYSSRDTVLYGHNMRNGSMFATLHNYEDATFFSEHPYMYVYTPDGLIVYQVFASYKDDNKLILNYYSDFISDSTYLSYINNIASGSYGTLYHYNSDVEITAEDQILSLSTCVSGHKENRFLVLGKRLSEEEIAALDEDMVKEATEATVADINECIADYGSSASTK